MKLAIAPLHNSHAKRDATGAFQPEMQAFCKHHGAQGLLFDNRAPSLPRFRQVLAFLASQRPHTVDALAVFCHGYKSGLQIGASLANCREFAEALQVACTADPVIALYCCDAARDNDDEHYDDRHPGPGGDGGFADKLRDELDKRGVHATIYGHSTTGHTTWNPWVRRFDPGEMAGGHWVVEPHGDLWAQWRRALRDTDLRFRFPFMYQFAIERELAAAGDNRT